MSIEYPPNITDADIAEAKSGALELYATGPHGKIGVIRYLRARLDLPLVSAKELFETQIDPAELARVDADKSIRDAAPYLLDALQDAVLQIEYLHDKFQETGSGNAVLAKIRSALAKATGETR